MSDLGSPTIGSLCSGYGGLDMAIESFFGAETAWFSEFEAAPSKVLAAHWPDVPNLGDMTKIDWSSVPKVDIIAGGTPCQDLSGAGKRKGMTEGTRSNLWVQMREAVATIRPSLVIWENVRGAFSAYAASEVESEPGLLGAHGPDRPALRALGRVLGDLSDLGYDTEWVGVRASDAGAPHGRFRVFVLAYAQSVTGRVGDGDDVSARRGTIRREPGARASAAQDSNVADSGERRLTAPGQAEGGRTWADTGRRSGAPTGDADDAGLEGRTLPSERAHERATRAHGVGLAAHAERFGGERRRGHGHVVGTSGTGETDRSERERYGNAVDNRSTVDWGGDLNATAHQAGSGEVLRDMRSAARTEEVQWASRGLRGVSAPESLRPSLREHEDDGSGRIESVEGSKAQGQELCGVRNDGESARSPYGQECGEQRPVESDDVMRESSPETALAGGPSEETCGCSAWGKYAPAIHRWERVLGRPAPAPTQPTGKGGAHRLSSLAVEFMMGLPTGWVTSINITRTEQLKALGNGVVPQQAVLALSILWARMTEVAE